MASRGLLLVPLLAALLAGCQDPYGHDGAVRAPKPERGDAQPPRARARDIAPAVSIDARATPRDAVGEFCAQWANWNWRTIERQQRRLAHLAAGTLARQLAAEAHLRTQDRTLRRDRLGGRGGVVGIDVKHGGHSRDAVCVAREVQLADGRVASEGARHRVYLATVVRMSNGWAITRWEPQP